MGERQDAVADGEAALEAEQVGCFPGRDAGSAEAVAAAVSDGGVGQAVSGAAFHAGGKASGSGILDGAVESDVEAAACGV